MEGIKILMLAMLGQIIQDLLKKLVDEKLSISSTITLIGNKIYKITLEEVADDTEV